MSVLYLLIPISLVMAALGVFTCFWAIRSGQFDNLEKDRWRVFFDQSDNELSKNRGVNENN